MSCIESLVFTPYLNFTSITLISPGGIPHQEAPVVGLIDEDLPDAYHMECFGLEARINVLENRVVELDRENKAVLLPDGAVIPYDTLVLTTGRQDVTAKRLGLWSPGLDPACLNVKGFMSLDLPDLGRKLETVVEKMNNMATIVLYGRSIRIMAVLQNLLDMGVDSDCIEVVRFEEGLESFGSQGIDDAVMRQLKGLGISCRTNCTLVGVELGIFDNVISVELQQHPGGKQITVACSLLLCGDEVSVDPDIFQAINNSGLVYDSRLVVDLSFRTVDPNIFAGGTLTKFSRIYRRSCSNHDKYNSHEVGEALASSLLEAVDPLAVEVPPPETPPVFSRPRTVSGLLPGGFHYCHSKAELIGGETGGNSFTTGSTEISAGQDLNYCLVHVTDLDIVSKLVYYGSQEVEPRNLSRLVGVNQSYLLSLMRTHDTGGVKDFIKFFRQDYFSMLYHDRFGQLVLELRDLLHEGDETAIELLTALKKGIEDGQDDTWLAVSIRTAVGAGGSNIAESTRKIIEGRTLDFVRKNKALLPTFLLAELSN
ncbi:unnamed protein product [Chrysoparadoxa australica]